MSERYTINFYNSNGGLTESMYTDSQNIEIGSGLLCDIRIQLPSIEDVHVKVSLNSRELLVFGNGVSLNDNPLDVNAKLSFDYGDIFKIYDKGFSIDIKDSAPSKSNKNLIKTCPLELCKEKNELIYGRNQKVLDCTDFIENCRVEYTSDDHDEVKEFIMRKNNVSEMDYFPVDENVAGENNSKKETNITTNVTSQCYIENGTVVKEITEKINIIEYEEIEVVENVSADHVIKTVEEIDLHEEPGDEEKKSEAKPEISTETMDKVDHNEGLVEENNEVDDSSRKQNQQNTDILMNHSEIQQAAKILENGPYDVEIEKVINEGSLDTLKQAIHSKKEDIDEEIKESYENIATDTPINPLQSKKTVVDLGDAVIEKEILNDAEKIVDEKLQSVGDKKDAIVDQGDETLKLPSEEDEKVEPVLQDKETETQHEDDKNKEEGLVANGDAETKDFVNLADEKEEDVNVADETKLEDESLDEKNQKVEDEVNQEEDVIPEDNEEIPSTKKKLAPKKSKAKPKPKAKAARKPPVVISATPRPIRKASVSAMLNLNAAEDEPVKRVRRNASVIGNVNEPKRKSKGKK